MKDICSVVYDLARYQREEELQIDKEEKVESAVTDCLKNLTWDQFLEALNDSNGSVKAETAFHETDHLSLAVAIFDMAEAYWKAKIIKEMERG